MHFRRNFRGNGAVVAVESRGVRKVEDVSERKYIKDGALLKEGKKGEPKRGRARVNGSFSCELLRAWSLLASRTLSVHTPYTLQ